MKVNILGSAITTLVFLMVVLVACGGGSKDGSGKSGTGPVATIDIAAEVAAAEAKGYISSLKAADHMGEEVTVRGLVKDYQYHDGKKGKPTLLLFDEAGLIERGSSVSDMETPNVFAVVVMRKHKPKFPPHYGRHYKDQVLCVTGTIEDYGGRPAMLLEDPASIEEGC